MKRNEYIGGRVLAARLQRHAVLYSVRHTSFPLPHSKADIRSSGAKEARRGSHVVSILLPSDAVWFSGRGPPMPDNPPTCFRGPHLQASLLWAPKFVESSDVRWCKPMAHASAQHWSNARCLWRRHFLRSIETFHQRQESATKTSIVTSGMMWEVELGLWQWGQKRSEPIFTIFIYIQYSLRWMAWVSARGNFSCTSWARMEALGACVIATLTCLLSIEYERSWWKDQGCECWRHGQFFQKEALERATPFSHVVSWCMAFSCKQGMWFMFSLRLQLFVTCQANCLPWALSPKE